MLVVGQSASSRAPIDSATHKKRKGGDAQVRREEAAVWDAPPKASRQASITKDHALLGAGDRRFAGRQQYRMHPWSVGECLRTGLPGREVQPPSELPPAE